MLIFAFAVVDVAIVAGIVVAKVLAFVLVVTRRWCCGVWAAVFLLICG